MNIHHHATVLRSHGQYQGLQEDSIRMKHPTTGVELLHFVPIDLLSALQQHIFPQSLIIGSMMHNFCKSVYVRSENSLII